MAMAGEKGEHQPSRQDKERLNRPSYLEARKYPSAEQAARAYTESQDRLRKDKTDSNLSIYRVMVGPTMDSHVEILGDPPNERLQAQLATALGAGEPVDLPYEVLQH
jgi:hypothetical protein